MRILIIILVVCALGLTFCGQKKDLSGPSGEGINASEVTLKKELADKNTTYDNIFEHLGTISKEINKQKEIEDFVFTAQYQPHLLLSLLNSDSTDENQKINRAILTRAQEYDKLHYIKFSIENKKFKSELLRYNATTPEEYSERISYYSFHIKNDVYLVENSKDTLKNAFVTFERTFDMSPKLNIVFAFERKKTEPLKQLTFVFEDLVFNNGKILFEYDYTKFSYLNSPEIKKIIP
ncbi:MAG: hypothetical protein K0S32_1162 [Bacteroidetes bacterium]|jgi:hypothetical protein|nr:hypothetical protein [Bacteroidota bacterium]